MLLDCGVYLKVKLFPCPPGRPFFSQSVRLSTQASAASRANGLRDLMNQPGILLGPCCYDALSAKLIEQAGFPFTFMSGFCTSAARLAAPDTGLITYSEMLDTGRSIHEATASIPVIGDGDTGYGNVNNVQRTVKGYAQAGFAGILIEDQVSPKSCGHVQGKMVVGREEALARISAAVDCRDEGQDIAILARTDARQGDSLKEALWRAAAFADAGADILFIDALESVEEMRAFCEVSPGTPKLANMLEGGKTPILLPSDLEEIGFKLVSYPLSLLGSSIGAMESALEGLKSGRIPQLPTFSRIQKVIGFPEYYARQEKYNTGTLASPPEPTLSERVPPSGSESGGVKNSTPTANEALAVDPDEILEQDDGASRSDYSMPSPGERSWIVATNTKAGSGQRPKDDMKQIRLLIRDIKTNVVKLETCFPTSFLSTVANLIPSSEGNEFETIVNSLLGLEWEPSKPIISIPTSDSLVEVYLE